MPTPSAPSGASRSRAYLTVPVYAAFHEWMGREDRLGDLWRLWKEGDRKAAAESIPESVVDELIVWGSPEKCREHLQRYVDNGVTTPAIAVLPFGIDVRQACPRPGSPLAARGRRDRRAAQRQRRGTPSRSSSRRRTRSRRTTFALVIVLAVVIALAFAAWRPRQGSAGGGRVPRARPAGHRW